jgi:hypothetical protein
VSVTCIRCGNLFDENNRICPFCGKVKDLSPLAAQPENSSFLPHQAENASTVPKREKVKWLIPLEIVGFLISFIYMVGGFFLARAGEDQALPKVFEVIQIDKPVFPNTKLSSDQLVVRGTYGDPEAFTLLFYQEPQDSGPAVDVRLENWTYYSQGVEITFHNGLNAGVQQLVAPIIDVSSTPYLPEQFSGKMTVKDLIATIKTKRYLMVPLDRDFIQYGWVYYSDRISFGIKKGMLTFVQGFAVQGGD